jgi:hypothetical protein
VQYSLSPAAPIIRFDRGEQRADVGVLVRLAVSEPVPSRIGRRPVRRAGVLVRKPHTQRRQWLIRAITVGTVRVECRHNMQPSAALAQEVVAARTTAFDCAINACVGVRNRRDAKKPRDDH